MAKLPALRKSRIFFPKSTPFLWISRSSPRPDKRPFPWNWERSCVPFGMVGCKTGPRSTSRQGTFDLAVFSVILGSFGAFVTVWPVSMTVGHTAKRTESWESRTLVTYYLTLWCSKSFWGHWMSVVVIKWPVTRKWLVVEQNGLNSGTVILWH